MNNIKITAGVFLLALFLLPAGQPARAVAYQVQINIKDEFNKSLSGLGAKASVTYHCSGGEDQTINDNNILTGNPSTQSDLDPAAGVIGFDPVKAASCDDLDDLVIIVSNLGNSGYLNNYFSRDYHTGVFNAADSVHKFSLKLKVKTELNEDVNGVDGEVAYGNYACVNDAATRSNWGCPVPITTGDANLIITLDGLVKKTVLGVSHAMSVLPPAQVLSTQNLQYILVVNSISNELGINIPPTTGIGVGLVSEGTPVLLHNPSGSGATININNGKIYLAPAASGETAQATLSLSIDGYVTKQDNAIITNTLQNLKNIGSVLYSLKMDSIQDQSGVNLMPLSNSIIYSAVGPNLVNIARQDYQNSVSYIALKNGATALSVAVPGFVTVNVNVTANGLPFNPYSSQRTIRFQNTMNNADFAEPGLDRNLKISVINGATGVALPDATITVYTDANYTAVTDDLSAFGNVGDATGNTDGAGTRTMALNPNYPTFYLKINKDGYTTLGSPSAPITFSVNSSAQTNIARGLFPVGQQAAAPSAVRSSYLYSKATAIANGLDPLTVVITVRDVNNIPVAGQSVNIINTPVAPVLYTFDETPKSTNAAGTVTFNIYSPTAGNTDNLMASLAPGESISLPGGTFTAAQAGSGDDGNPPQPGGDNQDGTNNPNGTNGNGNSGTIQNGICPTLRTNDMIKVRGKPAIYILNGNLKVLYFPTGDEFKSWRATYGGYISITQECYDSLPLPATYPGGVNYRPGSYVIKKAHNDQLYVVEPGNTLSKISRPAAQGLYGANFQAMTVAEIFWPHYINRGADISEARVHPGMTIRNDGKIWYVNINRSLSEITTDGLAANAFQDRFIYTVPDSAIANLPIGASITAEVVALTDKVQNQTISSN